MLYTKYREQSSGGRPRAHDADDDYVQVICVMDRNTIEKRSKKQDKKLFENVKLVKVAQH